MQSTVHLTIHGTLVCVDDVGVLIIGEAGTGKSECALELTSLGNKFVADDVIAIGLNNGSLIGKAPKRFERLLNIRDLGIIDVRQMFGDQSFKVRQSIKMCIEFQRGSVPNGFCQKLEQIEILGSIIPKIRLCVDERRNTRLLVETAVKIIKRRDALVTSNFMHIHDTDLAFQSAHL